jgi:hypothetical protein
MGNLVNCSLELTANLELIINHLEFVVIEGIA